MPQPAFEVALSGARCGGLLERGRTAVPVLGSDEFAVVATKHLVGLIAEDLPERGARVEDPSVSVDDGHDVTGQVEEPIANTPRLGHVTVEIADLSRSA